jgi:hypothetical protein
MEQRKSLSRLVSNLFNQPQPLATVSEEGAQQEEQVEEVPQDQDTMLVATPTPERPSRLRRISSSLLSLVPESKLPKDVLRKPVSRKQAPSQYQAPPTAPLDTYAEPTNLTVAPTSNRLQKTPPAPLITPEQAWQQSPEANMLPSHGPQRESTTPIVHAPFGHARVSVSPVNSRPSSYTSEDEGGNNAISKLQRKSWMPGGGKRPQSASEKNEIPFAAWVNAGENKFDYNIAPLLHAEKVSLLNTLHFPQLSDACPGT